MTSCRAYIAGMVRTQIQLSEQQARRLRARARELGVSLAELIRQFVDKGLTDTPDRAQPYDRAARLVGRFRDRHGATDVSSRHDDYLDEAYR